MSEEEKGVTLHYFGVKARAFGALVGGAYFGKDISWEQYSSEDWQGNKNDIKSKAAFGQLPVLIDGDFALAQSNAIVRYCGKKWGKEGESMSDYAMSEALIEEAEDIYTLMGNAKYKNGDTVEAWNEAYSKFPKHFKNLEKLMTGPVFASTVLMGDMALFAVINIILDNWPNILGPYLKLRVWYDGIANTPAVKTLVEETVIYMKKPAGLVFHYFDLKARGFAVPLAAAYYGRGDFHWEKYSFADWGGNKNEIKSKCCFSPQLPVLSDGDKYMSQSMAMTRYVASKWDLEGHSVEDFALMEQLIEESNDILQLLMDAKYKSPDADTPKKWNEQLEKVPKHLANLEKLLSAEKLRSYHTMGDFCLLQVFNYILDSRPGALKDFPTLKLLYNEMISHPNVSYLLKNTKAWYKIPSEPIVLHYFPIKARAIGISLAAAHQGIEAAGQYQWKPISFEDWGGNADDVKDKCAFGQLPAMSHGDIVMCQSMAITRYCAMHWNLEGYTMKEFAMCEQLIEQSNDMFDIFMGAKYNGDNTPATWDIQLAKMPKHLAKCEKLLVGTKFTNSLTMGDFCLFGEVNRYLDNCPQGLDDFKGLKGWYDGIASNAAVKALLESAEKWFLKGN